jgi:hypothetical protein
MTTTKQSFEQIKRGMALAFFASAYADQADDYGLPLGGEIMDQLPDAIDPAALHAADTLVSGMIDAHTFGEPGLSQAQAIGCLFLKVARCDRSDGDRKCTPELFGHYCAMQAMGSGVGLESFGSAARDAITIPHVEFGGHSLQLDYFDEADDRQVVVDGVTYTFDDDSVLYDGEEGEGLQFWFYHKLANPTADAIAELIRANLPTGGAK